MSKILFALVRSVPRGPLLFLENRCFKTHHHPVNLSVAVDLFQLAGHFYLVLTGRFSNWPMVACCGRTATADTVICILKDWMVDVGGPVKLTSDGGPQFKSHRFTSCCKEWHIIFDMSSPHYPQANGAAEAAVKTVKALVSKCAKVGDLNCDTFRALMELRNTSQANALSPTRVVFNRPIRSKVVAHPTSFAPAIPTEVEQAAKKVSELSRKSVDDYNLHAKKTSRP